jgi:hypothetical protein
MNSEQILSLIRTILKIVGTALVTKGVVSQTELSSSLDQLMLIIGSLLALGGTIWSVYSRRKAGLVSSAASLKEVSGVELTDATLARDAKRSVGDSATVRLFTDRGLMPLDNEGRPFLPKR